MFNEPCAEDLRSARAPLDESRLSSPAPPTQARSARRKPRACEHRIFAMCTSMLHESSTVPTGQCMVVVVAYLVG